MAVTGRLLCLVLSLSLMLFARGGEAASCTEGNQAIVTETILDDRILQVEWIRADPSDAAKTEALFVRTATSTIWTSVDEGKTFTKETSFGSIVSIEPTADPKKVYFLGREGQLWTTSDQGKTYKNYDTKLPFRYIEAHPTSGDMALGVAATKKCSDPSAPGVCKRDLYVTTDFGVTWKLKREYVQQAAWGAAGSDGVSVNTLLVITWDNPPEGVNQNRLSMYDMVFQRTRDLYVTIDYSIAHTAAFLFYKKTIFLAKLTGPDVNADLSMFTSINAGDSFNRAIFPKTEDLQENRYTVVDMTEGSAFINVDHSDDGSWGTTYGSNGLDTEFAEVLRYTKRNQYGAVDFRRIKGIEGIYLANRYLTSAGNNPNAGSHVRTVISWDKGGRWAKLKPPAVDANQKPISCTGSCSLNLLGRTQSSLGQFYSTENAVGLILATGSIGPWLEDSADDLNTYFSRDAGQSWTEVAKGAHVFEFGDHGAITILANNNQKTKNLMYSWDEGIEWTTCDFTDTEMDVTNIATEPSNTARNFILYGTRADKGVVVHIDFTASPIRQCQQADYELWSPRGDACLLGEHYTYQRRKQATKCFVEKEFERASNRTVCACVEEDYECDFCYRPTTDNPPRCVLACADFDPQKPPAECIDQYPVTKGYRLVPGDKCDTNSDISRTLGPEMRPCNATGDGDGGHPKTGLSGGAIFGIIFLVFFVIFAIAFLVLLVLAKTNPRVAAALKQVPLPRRLDLFGRFDGPGSGRSSSGARTSAGAGGYARVGQQTDNGSLLADLQQETDDTLQDETVDLDSPKDKGLIDNDDDDFDPRRLTTTSSTSTSGSGRGSTESLV